ncbi:MAG: metallophosphoesterase [Oscillospiraceae bacterium]
MKAVIQKTELSQTGRIIAISDVHGNLPYLKALLQKLRLEPGDELVLCGDMLEKGPYSLDTLRFIMELSARRRVLMLLGNCDGWHPELDTPTDFSEAFVKDYLLTNGAGWGPGLLSQMCAEIGFKISASMDMNAFRAALRAAFVPELDFLRALPHVIETPNYTFVHGGLPEGDPETWDGWRCMKNDDYMRQGRHFDKWLIVGHYPVVLYGGDITCANPIVDRESKIISIDGGCVLKDDGQLNALIIPYDGSSDFGLVSYDDFPLRRIKTAQSASARSTYIRWGDNEVEVLRAGGEFSRCRHVRTGYELDILTKYLSADKGVVRCNDCTDYVLPLAAGDEVSVVELTGRGALVKHKGVSGWYYGEFE